MLMCKINVIKDSVADINVGQLIYSSFFIKNLGDTALKLILLW